MGAPASAAALFPLRNVNDIQEMLYLTSTPMFRRLFNLAAGASVVLTAAIGFCWWQSYARSEKVTWSRDNHLTYLRAAPGQAVLYVYDAKYPLRSRDTRGFNSPAMSRRRRSLRCSASCSSAATPAPAWSNGNMPASPGPTAAAAAT
jgi:hypothetical protein